MLNRRVTPPSCPACGDGSLTVFYEAEGVPIHSVLLMATREEALSYPRGTIRLGFCEACGFITNTAFDPTLHEYSSRYEETQAFSPTFNQFHERLARRLVERYDLHGKLIIEIGCGKGEFLRLLCEAGGNRGIGLDPAYVPERNPGNERLRFIRDMYSEKYSWLQGDFIVCKMTLEHIHPVYDFVSMVRRSLVNNPDAVIFFQVPNVAYILRDTAFWDIYYEHCSYFSRGSLARLFRRCAFDVCSLSTEYGDQYLTLEARPAAGVTMSHLEEENDFEEVKSLVQCFASRYPETRQRWKDRVRILLAERRRIVVWGAGSKAVAFFTSLSITHDLIPYAVDINPYKQGTFLAGTGQEIVGPKFLLSYKPDVVIVMNPVYEPEIRKELSTLGICPELLTV